MADTTPSEQPSVDTKESSRPSARTPAQLEALQRARAKAAEVRAKNTELRRKERELVNAQLEENRRLREQSIQREHAERFRSKEDTAAEVEQQTIAGDEPQPTPPPGDGPQQISPPATRPSSPENAAGDEPQCKTSPANPGYEPQQNTAPKDDTPPAYEPQEIDAPNDNTPHEKRALAAVDAQAAFENMVQLVTSQRKYAFVNGCYSLLREETREYLGARCEERFGRHEVLM